MFEDEELDGILWADGFEDALIGICYRFGQEPIATYDMGKCISILEGHGMSNEEAEEYFDFNVIGAWVGERTPCFVTVLEEVNGRAA